MNQKNDAADELEKLKAKMWKKSFFVMARTNADTSKLAPNYLDHYRWIIDLEKQGKVYASGPLFNRDGSQAAGMTVFRVDSFEEAEMLAQGDPFVVSGAVTYILQEWQINEGRLNISVDLSDMTVTAR